MPVLSILNQVKGALPVSASFFCPTDGPCCLMVAGSAWTSTPNTSIGIQVEVDGKPVGAASLYANPATTHLAMVPTYIELQLSVGNQKLTLTPLNGSTITDVNDFFDAALMY